MEDPQIVIKNGKLTEVADTQLMIPSNGEEAAAIKGVEEEEEREEVAVGPAPPPQRRPKRPLQFEHAYLDSLPCANMYEKSYMHRDVVTHVAVSCADFFITGSSDGE